MALKKTSIQAIRKQLQQAARPLIFFDDDADGLCSFLLAYTLNSEAKPLRAAMGPELKLAFSRYVTEHQPDHIFVLDKPRADPQFFEEVRTPTTWIDHHDPTAQEPNTWPYNHLDYYNPALNDKEDTRPVSYWMREITQGPLWIAATGCTSDWDASLLDELRAEHPELLPATNDLQEILFNSPLGQIIQTLNFSLKGSTSAINKNLRALTKITTPQELLTPTTPASKHIHKHVKPLRAEYERQLAQALNNEVQEGVLVHIYENLQQSFVADVANELLNKSEAEIIIVGRSDGERINLSMRSHNTQLPPLLEEALKHAEGYGGGHENACGGSIVARDLEAFLKAIKQTK